MADNLTGAQRRRTMQAIRAKNTKPEIITRQFLHREGFRFRLHDRSLPGVPDVVLKKYRTAIFIHGCFWHQHGCRRSVLPKSRRSYWFPKLAANVQRHNDRITKLRALGWKVITIWECETKGSALRRRLASLFGRRTAAAKSR